MIERKIYYYQAKHIEETLRVAARVFKSETKETCLDRDIMEALEMIRSVIAEQPDKRVIR